MKANYNYCVPAGTPYVTISQLFLDKMKENYSSIKSRFYFITYSHRFNLSLSSETTNLIVILQNYNVPSKYAFDRP
jgi:hypothetical protein